MGQQFQLFCPTPTQKPAIHLSSMQKDVNALHILIYKLLGWEWDKKKRKIEIFVPLTSVLVLVQCMSKAVVQIVLSQGLNFCLIYLVLRNIGTQRHSKRGSKEIASAFEEWEKDR